MTGALPVLQGLAVPVRIGQPGTHTPSCRPRTLFQKKSCNGLRLPVRIYSSARVRPTQVHPCVSIFVSAKSALPRARVANHINQGRILGWHFRDKEVLPVPIPFHWQ
ncbi:hypothetical protein M404DRAFT_1007257 [Pisolithus tinctorius Marx 270]|uniref:Uncharacterized protein n=1 Tax=Pisolithus tinctorius Marx 270 TaxID=870435 RepID=A0A0C3NJU8_PISTI|nr:hypothetical protein M404DRAFT_1007257 [Pisolithus tinctorius Marx 270]